jgi:hypothetical protein
MNLRHPAWVSFALTTMLTLIAAFATVPTQAAVAATDRLKHYDSTTASAFLDGNVQLYAAPVKGKYGTPQTYRAQLLFARPDHFRLVLRPGTKEYRAVGSGGNVQWLDLSTGLSGQGKAVDLIDSAALDLLRSVGQLPRYAPAKELTVGPNSALRGAVLRPVSYRSQTLRAIAWFRNDQPHLFEIHYRDGRKLYFAVSVFQQNVATKPSDFVL